MQMFWHCMLNTVILNFRTYFIIKKKIDIIAY